MQALFEFLGYAAAAVVVPTMFFWGVRQVLSTEGGRMTPFGIAFSALVTVWATVFFLQAAKLWPAAAAFFGF